MPTVTTLLFDLSGRDLSLLAGSPNRWWQSLSMICPWLTATAFSLIWFETAAPSRSLAAFPTTRDY